MGEKTKSRKKLEKILLILLGTFIMTIGTFFFNVPSNIAAGGVTGFSQVLKHLMPSINIGLIIGFFNVLLFIAGAIFLGKEFGLFTLIGAGSFTVYMAILDEVVKLDGPILKDNLANLVIGAVFIGFGLGIVFSQNASTGGTDVISKIIEKYSDFSVSKGMMMADTSVILFASSVFGLESGIYSFLSLFITAYVLDVYITGFNSKIKMTIISSKVEDINMYIREHIFRGTTLYKAEGGYTREEKDILVTVVNKKQYLKIRNYIKKCDEHAFVYTTNISEVIGYGFSREFEHVPVREDTEIKD